MNTCHSTAVPAGTVMRHPGINQAIGTAAAVLILVLAGCAPGSDVKGPPFSVDILPPVIISAATLDGFRVVFTFDEAVEPVDGSFTVEPEIPVGSVVSEGDRIVVSFAEAQAIGETYVLRLGAGDSSGNTLEFVYEFPGWNPRVPGLLVTEVNPRGSGNTPDCIELLALTDGNLGGLWLTVGTENRYSGDITFPAVEIEAGDYILIHPKSEGLAEEIDETDALDASGGLLATDTARDFWIPGSPGLPGNNGAVTIHNRKGGDVIDAVLWSDRTTVEGDEKAGWTSDGYLFAVDLGERTAWMSTTGEYPGPSDAVDVSLSTATRSLCRASVPEDTDSRADWHTVPTRGASFGEANSDEVHIP